MLSQISLDYRASQALHTVRAELSPTEVTANLLNLRGIPCFSILIERKPDGIAIATGKYPTPENVEILPRFAAQGHAGFTDFFVDRFCHQILIRRLNSLSWLVA